MTWSGGDWASGCKLSRPNWSRGLNPQLHGGLLVADVRATVLPTGPASATATFSSADQWEMLFDGEVLFVLNHRTWPVFNPMKFYIPPRRQVHRGSLQVQE